MTLSHLYPTVVETIQKLFVLAAVSVASTGKTANQTTHRRNNCSISFAFVVVFEGAAYMCVCSRCQR